MNQSPTPDLPSWDELDLPVLDEVVDESAIPVLAEEVLDVPDFDFSSELDAAHSALPVPAEGVAELDIPELTLEDLEVSAPRAGDSPALDLTGLPSLDLSEAADELELGQVLHGSDPLSLAVAPTAQPAARPEVPLMAVDGFEFVLDEAMPAALAAMPDVLDENPPAPPAVAAAPSALRPPEAVAAQPVPAVEEALQIPALTDVLNENPPVPPAAAAAPSALRPPEAVAAQPVPAVEEALQIPALTDVLDENPPAPPAAAAAPSALRPPEAVDAQPVPAEEEALQIPDLSDELDIDWNSMAEQAEPALAVPPALADAPSHPAAPAELPLQAQAVDLPSPVQADHPPALPAGLSISLDSLPAGVLGGGIGRLEEETPSASELLARAQALVDATPASLDEVLRAAEQTLAAQDALIQPQRAAAPEAKSFTSLSEAELLEAMATLPTMQPASLIDQQWPGLGDETIADGVDAGLPDEADVLAASALLQDDNADDLAPATVAAQSPELTPQNLPVLDVEESWPGLGDVDRENETGFSLPDEADVLAASALLQDDNADDLAPATVAVQSPELTPQNLPVLDVEESWPGQDDVDRENETELALPEEAQIVPPVAASSVVPSLPEPPVLDQEAGLLSADAMEVTPPAASASAPVQGLFAESPFASEREAAPQPASPVALPVAAVAQGEPELPVLTDAEPDHQSVVEPLAHVAAAVPDNSSQPSSPASLETLTGASFAAAMPQTEAVAGAVAPEAGKSVEVLSVAAVTTAAAAAALMNPAARKEETVAVVDERALVDAMYEKLLPRMKVELSLWLQDALELQAKNMLSGVMQQLKEDYDMLFGETLKESLRQAILALGREQQGRHDAPRGEQD